LLQLGITFAVNSTGKQNARIERGFKAANVIPFPWIMANDEQPFTSFDLFESANELVDIVFWNQAADEQNVQAVVVEARQSTPWATGVGSRKPGAGFAALMVQR